MRFLSVSTIFILYASKTKSATAFPRIFFSEIVLSFIENSYKSRCFSLFLIKTTRKWSCHFWLSFWNQLKKNEINCYIWRISEDLTNSQSKDSDIAECESLPVEVLACDSWKIESNVEYSLNRARWRLFKVFSIQFR